MVVVVVVVAELHEKPEQALVGWFRLYHQTETATMASFIWNWRSRSILKVTMFVRIRNTLFVMKVIQSPRFFRISLSLQTIHQRFIRARVLLRVRFVLLFLSAS
jgi:hypothetical protein